MGNQINIEDFESLAFDDGVSKEEKEKIVKTYEASSTAESKPSESQINESSHNHSDSTVQMPKPEPKELSEE